MHRAEAAEEISFLIRAMRRAISSRQAAKGPWTDACDPKRIFGTTFLTVTRFGHLLRTVNDIRPREIRRAISRYRLSLQTSIASFSLMTRGTSLTACQAIMLTKRGVS